MKSVKGNKTMDVSVEELKQTAQKYTKTHVDLGTGDGRFIYESAVKNPDTLFIGLDPVEKQLREYSVRSVRKGVENAIFLVCSLENLPDNFTDLADQASVILPWGSLLAKIVLPEQTGINKITRVLKKGGVLTIVLGYSPDFEPSETTRLELPELSTDCLENVVVKGFLGSDPLLKFSGLRTFSNEKLKDFGSNWAKKLAFGKPRDIYELTFTR